MREDRPQSIEGFVSRAQLLGLNARSMRRRCLELAVQRNSSVSAKDVVAMAKEFETYVTGNIELPGDRDD